MKAGRETRLSARLPGWSAVVDLCESSERPRRRSGLTAGVSAIAGAAGVETLHRFLRHEFGKILARKNFGFRALGWIFRAIAALVGNDQINVPAPA